MKWPHRHIRVSPPQINFLLDSEMEATEIPLQPFTVLLDSLLEKSPTLPLTSTPPPIPFSFHSAIEIPVSRSFFL